MPDIILTQQKLHELSGSAKGHGFTNAQIRMLGIQAPAARGWLKKLIGTSISAERFEEVKAAYGVRVKREHQQEADAGKLPIAFGLRARDRIKASLAKLDKPEHRIMRRLIWEDAEVLMHLAGIEPTAEERMLFI